MSSYVFVLFTKSTYSHIHFYDTEAVNSVSRTIRDRTQCETRLRCFTSKVRTGEIFYRKARGKTGGGPPVRIKLSAGMLELVELAYIYMGNASVAGMSPMLRIVKPVIKI